MDHLDRRILRLLLHGGGELAFQPDFRQSFRAMGRKLGVDEGTIRNRIRRFEESGFVQRWRLRINPRLWGGNIAGVWMDYPRLASRQRLVEQLKLVPGVDAITLHASSLVTIFLQYDSEQSLRSRVKLVQAIVGPEEWGLGDLVLPRCHLTPTRTDWEILRSLENDPRKPYQEVADELGVSSRTVARRLQQLVEDRVAFVSADFDLSALSGSLMASLLAHVSNSLRREVGTRIADHLDRLVWHRFLLVPLDGARLATWGFNLVPTNVGRARVILEQVRRFPGVTGARIAFAEEVITLPQPTSWPASLPQPTQGRFAEDSSAD